MLDEAQYVYIWWNHIVFDIDIRWISFTSASYKHVCCINITLLMTREAAVIVDKNIYQWKLIHMELYWIKHIWRSSTEGNKTWLPCVRINAEVIFLGEQIDQQPNVCWQKRGGRNSCDGTKAAGKLNSWQNDLRRYVLGRLLAWFTSFLRYGFSCGRYNRYKILLITGWYLYL